MAERLNEYNGKRNFERTLEPIGRGESAEDLRFVVQHHIARRDHYDFRLEWKGTLLSWAIPKGPSYDTGEKRLSIKVEDHPIDYRNFEGTIPKGEYGGGVVMLWDEGYWEPYSSVEDGLREGVLKFALKGVRLKGKWSLVQLKARDDDDKDNWILLKEKDEYAKSDDGISEYITSIRTGRTMKEIEEGKQLMSVKNPFDRTDVQLAKLANDIPKGDDWLYELKYDGYRILAYIESNSVRLVSRNNNDYTRQFIDIANSLNAIANGRAMVIDGEMTVTNEAGKTDFSAIQNYLNNPKGGNLTYFVFDILALDGKDLRELKLIERKKILEAILKDAPEGIHYSRHIEGKGQESFKAACKAEMEGIIGKKVDSVYSGNRNNDWIKIKCDLRQEFVIGGYTLSDKKTSGISSLLLGVYEGEELIFIGRAGTGLREVDMRKLEEQFERIKSDNPPFKQPPKQKTNEIFIYLKPEMVAEVKFAEWTKENLLRQASFKGIRVDKNPKDVKKEIIEAEPQLPVKESDKMKEDIDNILKSIKITNPDKVVFDEPRTTKAEILQYYAKISERMLAFVSNRILSAVRCPKGISEPCFYKKHPMPGSKGIITIPISDDKEKEAYFYIENAYGLLSEAQMGTLEFHIWGSRVEELEKPDMMVFDLDPDEGMNLDTVRQGVRDLKGVLAELSLKSYLKTSGGKGYHVVVPFRPTVSWDVFYDFARRVAQVMEQKWPERYTSNSRKAKRTNKIFIDWMRNGRGSTSIAPYSIRARKGACVSMPIRWDELDTVAPDGVNMAQALLRVVGKDPWEDFFMNNQILK